MQTTDIQANTAPTSILQQSQSSPLIIEWATLQNQYDAFEKLSLTIKLCAIFVSAALMFDIKYPGLVLFFNVIFWVQDAIWKTFQSRFAERLVDIERELITKHTGNIAFNIAWEERPRSIVRLLSEYLRHLAKPTIVFPHAILLCLSCYIVLIA